MIKQIFIIMMFLHLYSYAQKNRNIDGIYGKCYSHSNCFQIKLNKDNTFSYYVDNHFLGRGIVKGTWSVLKDTLLLNKKQKKKDKSSIKKTYNPSIIGSKLILSDAPETNSLPLICKVIINNKLNYMSNYKGIVDIPDTVNIKKIKIINIDNLWEKTYLINHKLGNNLFKINIDLSSLGVDTKYLITSKWMIRRKKLIPIWRIEHKDLLKENLMIKKTSKKNLLPQLGNVVN